MQDEQVNKILRQLEQGNLSEAEAEKMLQQIIDQALSGKLDAPVDMALVERCQSLIWNLRTKGQFPYQDHALKNQRKLERKLERESRKKRDLPLIKAAVAACLFVLIFPALPGNGWTGAPPPTGSSTSCRGTKSLPPARNTPLHNRFPTTGYIPNRKKRPLPFWDLTRAFPRY